MGVLAQGFQSLVAEHAALFPPHGRGDRPRYRDLQLWPMQSRWKYAQVQTAVGGQRCPIALALLVAGAKHWRSVRGSSVVPSCGDCLASRANGGREPSGAYARPAATLEDG